MCGRGTGAALVPSLPTSNAMGVAMDSMATFFPNERGVHDVALFGDTMPSLVFHFGNSYISLQRQTPETCRRCAEEIIAAVEKWEAEKCARDDAKNRTPDAELDASEREDIPEEVAKGRIMEQWEEHRASEES